MQLEAVNSTGNCVVFWIVPVFRNLTIVVLAPQKR